MMSRAEECKKAEEESNKLKAQFGDLRVEYLILKEKSEAASRRAFWEFADVHLEEYFETDDKEPVLMLATDVHTMLASYHKSDQKADELIIESKTHVVELFGNIKMISGTCKFSCYTLGRVEYYEHLLERESLEWEIDEYPSFLTCEGQLHEDINLMNRFMSADINQLIENCDIDQTGCSSDPQYKAEPEISTLILLWKDE